MIVLFARDVLAIFPAAALGALVIYAATRLIDIAEFRRLARFRRSELSSRWRPPRPCSASACSTACLSRLPCRSSTCSVGSPVRTTASSASFRGWPACTMSTTTRTRD